MPFPGYFRFRSWLWIFALVATVFGGDGGGAGLPVLKAPVSSWQSALGEVMTLGEDGSWTNQSQAAWLNDVNVMMNYESWFTDVSSSFLGAHFPAGNFVISTQLFFNQINGLEVRTAATEQPDALTEAHTIYAKLGAGYRVNDRISVGLSVKYIGEKIFSEGSQGYAVDLSGSYRMETVPLEFSLLVANLGKMDNLLYESTQLPLLFAAGAKYGMMLYYDQIELNLIGEVRESNSASTKVTLGSEINMLRMLAFQVGYILNDDLKSFTMGTHVYYKKFRFGMGWVPTASDFGDHFSFSLAVSF